MPISCSSAAQRSSCTCPAGAVGIRAPEQGVGQSGDARRVLAVDMVALQEVLDGELPRIPVYRPAKQIVEHPQPQRAADRVDSLDVELGHRGAHDGQSPGEHRHTLGLERVELEPGRVARAYQPLAQAGEARLA